MSVVARMILEYKRKTYWLEYDFECDDYPVDGAEFMFFDGNYSCDCNKSLFLGRAGYSEFKEEFPCGDEIEIVAFTVFK